MSHNAAVAPGGVAADRDEVGRIERRGIDVVPDSERHGKPRELFWIWLPANVSFLYILLGGVMIALGLNIWQAILAVLVGNAFYLLIGVVATAGPTSGTSTLMVSRAQYGLRGNQFSAFIWWFNLLAFEAINFAIGTTAGVSLARLVGIGGGDGTKAVILAIIVALTMSIVVLGHATIVRFQSLLAYSLIAVSIALFVFLLGDVDWGYQPTSGLEGAALLGVWFVAVTIIAAGPLSWCGAPADFSRYLPRRSSPRAITWSTGAGAALPSVFLAIVAIMAATVVDMSDPTVSLEPLIPAWFYPIFLIVVVVGSICNNVLGIYSSGLSLQTLGLRLQRYTAVVLHGVVGLGMTVYALFISDFLPALTEYLQFATWWYAPFVAIFIVDLYLRRRDYDGVELHRPEGRYWYRGGFHWPGLVALASGMFVAFMTANTTLWQSPVSTDLLSGADISPLTGLVVGGLVYWVLMRRSMSEASLGRTADPGRGHNRETTTRGEV